eukprot:CAMPEP_0172562810 /NCGR_PEP_ID=MMETSP1067-20121228/98508_1 /TAXON_ID=265564 ORGANISM="Thalassiosira punctigera, Strain Tpunct2005C2" /NCGR_SAMPLE_ID=MMETSP1067 /ASSEMBLY_ACC=CAM_ASM_000444 /LENGTH=284 /DNA_ID=CAMNT_0013353115 /DNA_START=97 /DNA_END=951 /DNA_ORIENTATION=+
MGKKRTNVAKKKLAAKKKRLSSTYGVSVLKGGTLASKNGVLDENPIGNDNLHTRKRTGHVTSSNDDRSATNQAYAKRHVNGKEKPTIRESGKRTRDGQSENKEFERMHVSLEERCLAAQARKDDQRRSKKERQKYRKKGWGKFARPSTNNFTPATLTLTPKNTQELVDDAANQVAQGMNDIGQRAAQPVNGLSVMPGQSSLAAAAGLGWKMQASIAPNQTLPHQNPNSFAALGEDSDGDNEWTNKQTNKVQQFRFKPASFSFQSNISYVPAMGPGANDDIDPDL